MFSAASTASRSESPVRRRLGRRAHLLVDVGGEPLTYSGVERAADGIALSADLDRHDLSVRSLALLHRFQILRAVTDSALRAARACRTRGRGSTRALPQRRRPRRAPASARQAGRCAASSSRDEPRVLFGGARLVGLQPADHRDQHLHFLFEPIDRFEIDGCGLLQSRDMRDLRLTL